MVKDARIKKISPNLLIHKIRSGDKPMKLEDPNDYKKYLRGEFAEIGKHW
jgi:hypothetical protein